MEINTCEMHTGGEPVRIIESGYPQVPGETILLKRQFLKEKLDHLRKLLMWEPRGHFDMYGALLLPPTSQQADIAVIFMHNEGYSTMCGHAVIALARYAIDKGLVKTVKSPETRVVIECPCGLVECFTEVKSGQTGHTRFQSVPAFVFATDVSVEVPGHGEVHIDISYGGAFYAVVAAGKVGLCVRTSRTRDLVDTASAITDAVKKKISLRHPDSADLAFLYGSILTDGKEEYSEEPTANICVFADRQVDRAPTGSGVTARIALQYSKGCIKIGNTRKFESAVTGDIFTGKVVREVKCGDFPAVTVEVRGKGWYTGTSRFTLEETDHLGRGFLPS